jgi:hypothetical protein
MPCYRDRIKPLTTPSAKTTLMIYTRKEELLIIPERPKDFLMLIV